MSNTDEGFILTPEIEQKAKDAIERYEGHLKFYGYQPEIRTTREGVVYTVTLTAQSGYERRKVTSQGVSTVSRDFALLSALEEFYTTVQNG